MNLPAEPHRFRADAAATAAVERLRIALEAAFETASPARGDEALGHGIRTALEAALADDALVTPAQRACGTGTYQRHLIFADPRGRYAVASLVWPPGQASPVHAHHTWCGYAVLDGTLTETLYTWDEAAGHARETRSRPRAAGAVSFAGRGRGAAHRLANSGDAPVVSLHVYGVTGQQIGTHVNDVLPLAHAA
ncbi:cysteine dioxygenase [Burkholderia sp. WAC0059]|uniref:cysteine dioxygenase family protein n=1 Tax=Burkholderia sp. WAC0059 TaxID=2066022 RepID=UPI000C7EBED4|nr:cysteine dioxygenase family protein [Burkholderia sp. WAC0059]PLZ04397.1 cysteine dioxygenase [Burkholderia sp. WAC0059]